MTDWIRWIALASLAIYFVIDFLDSRRVEDEREKLIQLKALELAHKATMATLTFCAFSYAYLPSLDAQYVILSLILVALYGELGAKIYYRSKL